MRVVMLSTWHSIAKLQFCINWDTAHSFTSTKAVQFIFPKNTANIKQKFTEQNQKQITIFSNDTNEIHLMFEQKKSHLIF